MRSTSPGSSRQCSRGRADAALLDTYEAERISFARRLVATTDRAFSFVTADGPLADLVRTRVAPVVLSTAVRLERGAQLPVPHRLAAHAQLPRHGPERGGAGGVHGGDRLPWVGRGALDNHEPLRSIGWQAHVYGDAVAELRAACSARRLPLHTFPWSDAHAAAGLKRDALYLLRPDTYVALAAPAPAPQVLERYFQARGSALSLRLPQNNTRSRQNNKGFSRCSRTMADGKQDRAAGRGERPHWRLCARCAARARRT